MRKTYVTALLLALFLLGRDSKEPIAAPSATADDVRTLITAGEPDSALSMARHLLSSDSGNVGLLLALADAQKAKKQMKERRETLESIIQRQPRTIDARVEIAKDFFEAQQLDSASYYALAALTRSSRRSAIAYYWLGRIHEQAGRPDSALFYYRGAWVLLPNGDLF